MVNDKRCIGLVIWREVYIFYQEVIQLKPEVDRGRLVYRQEALKQISVNAGLQNIRTNTIIGGLFLCLQAQK
jgi:hypothetical protein